MVPITVGAMGNLAARISDLDIGNAHRYLDNVP